MCLVIDSLLIFDVEPAQLLNLTGNEPTQLLKMTSIECDIVDH